VLGWLMALGGLGWLMAFGGQGWLTFLSPSLANELAPYNLAPGILGEASLTLWLLIVGVNGPRWRERAVLRRPAPTLG
jgi:hypothetical protein